MRGVWKRIVLLVLASALLWGVVGGVGCWRYSGEWLLSMRSVWFWSGLVTLGCVAGNLLAMVVTVLLSKGPSDRGLPRMCSEQTPGQEVPSDSKETPRGGTPRTYSKPLVGLLGAMIPQMGVPLVLALIVRILATEAERTFFLYAMLVTWLPLFALETVLALRWLNSSCDGNR